MRTLVVFGLLAMSCSTEPAFIQACEEECACTSDSFACTPPRSGGCDNAYRRAWVLAQNVSADCAARYEAYFNCKHQRSVCSGGEWEVPSGACDSEEDRYRECS